MSATISKTSPFRFWVRFPDPIHLWFSCLGFFLAFSAAQAHNILFYFNSGDGSEGALLQCVSLLRHSGHQVTVIDVRGLNRDPSRDNWGPPFDQVWDMRFVDRDSTACGSGRPDAADYFDENWKSKSVSFLNHCGKLFIGAEYYTYVDRDEGLYSFLREIRAVKPGYDPCPPSPRGNSSTPDWAFYRVRPGLGPSLFYGEMVGGIPLNLLTGTSFVDTREGWEGDQVDRSVVCAWTGNQLGGAVNADPCHRGKLLMVWDATMWTLWQQAIGDTGEAVPPIWDDSAWVPGNLKEPLDEASRVRKARRVTMAFFPAVVKWLGSRECPCFEAHVPATTPLAVLPTPIPQPRPSTFKPSVTMAPVHSLLAAAKPVSGGTPAPSWGAAQTLVFSGFPVNIYMAFRDGVGDYRLDILDFQGRILQTVFNKPITTQKESWAVWDGMDLTGREMPAGLYYAALSKDGRSLRKVVLQRTP